MESGPDGVTPGYVILGLQISGVIALIGAAAEYYKYIKENKK